MKYEDGMTLGEIIDRLAAEKDKKKILYLGFSKPHSYRGYYECLAFAPTEKITVAKMIEIAEHANGGTCEGWKGGHYEMTRETECYLAFIGDTGVPITSRLLEMLLSMFEEVKVSEAAKFIERVKDAKGEVVSYCNSNPAGVLWERLWRINTKGKFETLNCAPGCYSKWHTFDDEASALKHIEGDFEIIEQSRKEHFKG